MRKFAPAIKGESTNSVSETSLKSISSRRSRNTGSAVANFQPVGNLIDVTPFAGFPYDPSDKGAMDVSPEERQATYERLWAEEGGFKFTI